jgi:hypothetical protein
LNLFSTATDASVIKQMDAESFRLYYTPREWLVNNDSITKNLYGETGVAIVGSDGITSVSTTKKLTSASSDFVTLKVKAGDVLEMLSVDSGDKGRYKIASIIDLHNITIPSNWPVGGLTAQSFSVIYETEQYTPFAQLVPFQLLLDPSDKDLKKWGIEEKTKPVDALIKLSIQACDEMGLVPKIGDRFNYTIHVGPPAIIQQFEVFNLIKRDQVTDSGYPLHYIGAASKTREIY